MKIFPNISRSSRITASPLMNTTILFLIFAPLAIIIYSFFVFNPQNADNIVLYIIQVIADSISMIVLLSLWLTILMDVLVEQHHRSHEHFIQPRNSDKPSVDVFITVAGEPTEIVEQTLQAVVAIQHPHRTFILDDGKSREMRVLARQYGAQYITRQDRAFAKSGNLNNGLIYANGEFFAIFDADQVPTADFLDVVLPYFSDQTLAMVQTPQYFNNTDQFIARGTAQSQEIFYKFLCPAKNISNSAFCVGTNVVFRRSAINEVGGIARLGHSEDIWTSLSLHEKGWKTLFINEILAEGKAPSSVSSFFKQQLRWAEGGLSMLFFKNPLASKTLTLDQKFQYFSANFFYLVGISILAYISFPIIYLLFGVKSLETENGIIWLLHYVPYFSMYYMLTWLLLGRLSLATVSTSLASFYPYLLAFSSVIFGTKNDWVATTSKKSSEAVIMKWIWPHVLIMILTLMSFVVGWYEPRNFSATFFNTCWAGLNLYLLFIFVTGEHRKVHNVSNRKN